ncbi:hypothetical protein BDQ12DRAFT_724207 [Crucibulum laeve]|uniref:Hydrophobin n=1 Tax=Crucibulum laeve TaxID=68775 RepID=A0A5C3LW44_9AGAR|nr:hypothetical protein BDQ12DRAFT_724207 [Crucibulum laeve]
MYKIIIILAIVSTAQQVLGQEGIPIGGTCATIAGPLGSCVTGSVCCYVSPDFGLGTVKDYAPLLLVLPQIYASHAQSVAILGLTILIAY